MKRQASLDSSPFSLGDWLGIWRRLLHSLKNLIFGIELLQIFRRAKKADFEELLLDKISDALDEKQKKYKIKNILKA